MKRLIFTTFVAALLSLSTLSLAQSAAPQPTSTIQANTNLVVVDVEVTDAHDNAVHKLSKSDFGVLESGHPQTIKSFEEHSSLEAAAPLPVLPKLPPGTFTNVTSAPASGALNVVLLDALNTPMTAQATVRDQMLKFLKEERPGTRIAVFGLTSKLLLLQGFTTDPELLRTVLNGKKGLPKGSPVMYDALNGDNPGADDPLVEIIEDGMGNDPSASFILANIQQFEAESAAFQLQLRTRLTLDALNMLGRYLGNLPGRKNLIWFSGSFPLNILPNPDIENPFAVVASSEQEFRETTTLLSRAQVAVYPIDARGITTEPMLDVENSGSKYTKSPTAFGKDLQTFSQNNADEHGTMEEMARATGGHAYVNTNGLKEAVEKAIENGSNYYTLTYSPTDQKWNGEFRKIQIKVAQSGLNLSYRRGYYAIDPNIPNAPNAQSRKGEPAAAAAAQPVAFSAMREAMMRGAPDPTQITFAVNLRPASAAPEPDVAPGNRVAAKSKGPYKRYAAQFGISARDITCPLNPDGTYSCNLDAMIFVYDADGAVFNSVAGGIRAVIPASTYAPFLQNGIHFRQDVSVPIKGEYFLRIGIHDDASNKVGAVELPVAAVSNLPPLSAAQPTPASK